MKLDSRIKRGKKPFTPLDIDKAREFIGEACLFSNCASFFENLDKVDPRIDFYQLRSINEKDENDCPFKGVGMFPMYGDYRYCLPAKFVKIKELKYRITSDESFKDIMEFEDQEN